MFFSAAKRDIHLFLSRFKPCAPASAVYALLLVLLLAAACVTAAAACATAAAWASIPHTFIGYRDKSLVEITRIFCLSFSLSRQASVTSFRRVRRR